MGIRSKVDSHIPSQGMVSRTGLCELGLWGSHVHKKAKITSLLKEMRKCEQRLWHKRQVALRRARRDQRGQLTQPWLHSGSRCSHAGQPPFLCVCPGRFSPDLIIIPKVLLSKFNNLRVIPLLLWTWGKSFIIWKIPKRTFYFRKYLVKLLRRWDLRTWHALRHQENA